MEDEQIIRAILAGDKDQFAILIDRYQHLVADLCYKMYGNKLEIDEVTQRVFVELYKALPSFKFKSKLSTFIYSITVNVTHKMFNREKRYISPSEVDNPLEQVSESRNAEQEIIRREQHHRLHWAISQLPLEQQQALTLFYFEEIKYQEIADVMQCTLSKVESLIFRAKKNLSKYMQQ